MQGKKILQRFIPQLLCVTNYLLFKKKPNGGVCECKRKDSAFWKKMAF